MFMVIYPVLISSKIYSCFKSLNFVVSLKLKVFSILGFPLFIKYEFIHLLGHFKILFCNLFKNYPLLCQNCDHSFPIAIDVVFLKKSFSYYHGNCVVCEPVNIHTENTANMGIPLYTPA